MRSVMEGMKIILHISKTCRSLQVEEREGGEKGRIGRRVETSECALRTLPFSSMVHQE